MSRRLIGRFLSLPHHHLQVFACYDDTLKPSRAAAREQGPAVLRYCYLISYRIGIFCRRFKRDADRGNGLAAFRRWRAVTLVHRCLRQSAESGVTFATLHGLSRGFSVWQEMVSTVLAHVLWCAICHV